VWVRNADAIADLVRDPLVRLHPSDAARRAIQGGDSVIVAGTHEFVVALDERVSLGTIVVPFNLEATKGLAAEPVVTVDVMRGDS